MSKNVISVSDIWAVNFIVKWKLFVFFTKLSILSRLVFADILVAVEPGTISEALAHVNAKVVLDARADTLAKLEADTVSNTLVEV